MAELTIIQFPNEPAAFDIDAQAGAADAAAGGDTFRAGSRVGIWVQNSSGASRTVTIDAVKNCNHGVEHDAAVVVPNGFEGFIAKSLRPDRFMDSTGMISLTYDNDAGLRVAAVNLS